MASQRFSSLVLFFCATTAATGSSNSTSSTNPAVQWFVYSEFDGTTCEAESLNHNEELYPAGYCVDRSSDSPLSAIATAVNDTTFQFEIYLSNDCTGSVMGTLVGPSSACDELSAPDKSLLTSDDIIASVIDMRACMDEELGTRPMLYPLDTCIKLQGMDSYPGKFTCIDGQLRVLPFDDPACTVEAADAAYAIVEKLTFAEPGTCKTVTLPWGEMSIGLYSAVFEGRAVKLDTFSPKSPNPWAL
eukprot:CAMPEP_0181460886 /NCGR_PEP_ID=MMETSP1110-20121109/33580_1 /TAXON_ID=174948 /ORGANISM="Symbiodinium sp., Strain CCMP421" /LENGTH=244 /DNA_ID=CAMNT_0023585467 /DNA_START=48 /DNA_END=783 /DNA_ORIENTATION=-